MPKSFTDRLKSAAGSLKNKFSATAPLPRLPKDLEAVLQKPLSDLHLVTVFQLGKTHNDLIHDFSKRDQAGETDKTQAYDLLRDLDMTYHVSRIIYSGETAQVAPQIYPSPIEKDQAFYMICPIGYDAKGEITHHTPEDATELTDDHARAMLPHFANMRPALARGAVIDNTKTQERLRTPAVTPE